MVQSTDRPGGCRPSNHRLCAVLCRCHLGTDSQSQRQGFMGFGPRGQDRFLDQRHTNSENVAQPAELAMEEHGFD